MGNDRERENNGHAAVSEPVSIGIDYRRFNRNLLITLITIEVLLIIVDATINYHGWLSVPGLRRMANIAREDGIATWFMSTQTLFTGMTVFLIYLGARHSGTSKRFRDSWLVISLLFFFMAADDAAQIHERLGSAFSHYAEKAAGSAGGILDSFPSYPWQLIILPFFAVLGLFMLVFVWSQIRSSRGRIKLILAFDCFAVAIFLDFIEGLEPDHPMNLFFRIINSTSISEDAVYHFAKVIEESLEMLAITLLLSIFFIYLAETVPSLGFKFIRRDE